MNFIFILQLFLCIFYNRDAKYYFRCSLAHKAMRMAAAMASIKKAGTTYIINVWFLLMSGCCCLSVVVVFLF